MTQTPLGVRTRLQWNFETSDSTIRSCTPATGRLQDKVSIHLPEPPGRSPDPAVSQVTFGSRPEGLPLCDGHLAGRRTGRSSICSPSLEPGPERSGRVPLWVPVRLPQVDAIILPLDELKVGVLTAHLPVIEHQVGFRLDGQSPGTAVETSGPTSSVSPRWPTPIRSGSEEPQASQEELLRGVVHGEKPWASTEKRASALAPASVLAKDSCALNRFKLHAVLGSAANADTLTSCMG